MRKSARVLGAEHGLSAAEMNYVLKEDGFLDGEPGRWRVTDKGEPFAAETDESSSSSSWAKQWTVRTWDDSINEELSITPERKQELREAMAAAKREMREREDEPLAFEIVPEEPTDEVDGNRDALVLAVGAILVGATAYGVYKAIPHIREWWGSKAVPGLKSIESRFRATEHEAEGR